MPEKAVVTIEGVVKGPLGHPFTTITNTLWTKDNIYIITSSKTDLDTNEDLIGKKVIAQGYVSEHERAIPEAGEFHKVKQKTIEVISYRVTE